MQTRSDGNNLRCGSVGRGGLALVLTLIVFGCASVYRYADPPHVSLAGIRILDVTLFEQRYLLALRVQNPNSIELPIEGMSYTLAVNGSELAHGVNSQQTVIPAFGEQVLHVTVVANLLSTLKQLGQWEHWPPPKFDYQLSGKIQLANVAVSLPFEYSGEIELQGGEPPLQAPD